MADDRDSGDALVASCELLSGTPEYTTDWLGYGLQSSSSEYPPHHSSLTVYAGATTLVSVVTQNGALECRIAE